MFEMLTLFYLSTICLMVHLVFCEDAERPTRYAGDPDFGNLENVKSSDQHQDATLFESEPFGTQDRGNYFMYMHVPKPDHYEFAYKRGNEHHYKQHHEKAAPHEGHFKIQARWGDKHGGYGEHYWDYNHGGDAHEEGTNNEEIYDPSHSQNSKTLTPLDIPSSPTNSRGALLSEDKKFDAKNKKHYKKKEYDDFRKKKIPVTEATPVVKTELYQDIPKHRSRPYDRDYQPIESRNQQNSNLHPHEDENFPITYDVPKKRPNYDKVHSMKSYNYEPGTYV